MLLVDDRKSKITEDYIILNQGMRADYYADAAILETGVNFSSLCSLAASGEQGCLNIGRSQEFLDIFVVQTWQDSV